MFDTQESKDWLRSVLSESEVTIVFTKKDGTNRTMVCTLSEKNHALSEYNRAKSEHISRKKEKSNDSLAVFDVEKNAWRSFRYDSIKEITVPV